MLLALASLARRYDSNGHVTSRAVLMTLEYLQGLFIGTWFVSLRQDTIVYSKIVLNIEV